MDWDYLHKLYKQFPQKNDATDLLFELDNLLIDWDNFFKLYMQHAAPPTNNTDQIQAWFKELKTQHKKCIILYKRTLNRAINTNYGEFSLMYGQPNLNKKDKASDITPEDDVSYI